MVLVCDQVKNQRVTVNIGDPENFAYRFTYDTLVQYAIIVISEGAGLPVRHGTGG
jgi:hypothetical protein